MVRVAPLAAAPLALAALAVEALAALSIAGCFTKAPAVATPIYPLYVDLSKIVTTRSRGGWEVDEREIDEGAWKALPSVCRATEVTRADLLAWLDRTIVEKGGPVEEAYLARGRKRGKVRELMELTRIRLLLRRAMDRTDHCPFWVEPDPKFAGLHGNANRLVLMFESNGTVSFVPVADGNTTFAGGGSGRLLAGWGFGHFFTLILGGELGGAGTFRAPEVSGANRELVPRFFGVLPVVARFHYYSWSAELEGAFGWQAFEYDFVPRPGFRAAFSIGGSVMRVSGILPYATLGLSMERFRLEDGTWETYWGGVYRVGFNLDPWNR